MRGKATATTFRLISKRWRKVSEEGTSLIARGHWRSLIGHTHSYASIGAILISKKVADGIRDTSGFWKHGHTYQVRVCSYDRSYA